MALVELLHAETTNKIIGAAMEVHSALGPGYLESIYEQAMSQELSLRELPFDRQVRVPIFYKQVEVGRHVLDLLVNRTVVVELKAIEDLAPIHTATILSYLAATKLSVALLINFGKPKLDIKRVVRQRK